MNSFYSEIEVKKQTIVEAGKLLFSEKGFDKTTLQDVIDYLNIKEHIFHDYFQSLDDLLEVIWSES